MKNASSLSLNSPHTANKSNSIRSTAAVVSSAFVPFTHQLLPTFFFLPPNFSMKLLKFQIVNRIWHSNPWEPHTCHEHIRGEWNETEFEVACAEEIACLRKFSLIFFCRLSPGSKRGPASVDIGFTFCDFFFFSFVTFRIVAINRQKKVKEKRSFFYFYFITLLITCNDISICCGWITSFYLLDTGTAAKFEGKIIVFQHETR